MTIEEFRYLPRVQEIMAEIDKIKDARADLLEAQSLSISGSHSVTRVKLEELRVLEATLSRELIILAQNNGITSEAIVGRKRAYYDK